MRLKTSLLLLGMCAVHCAAHNSLLSVSVNNNTSFDRFDEIVELSADSIGLDKDSYYRLLDESGREHPFQLTYNGLLIFQTDLEAYSQATYSIVKGDSPSSFQKIASGKIYPEHNREIAWENEYMGFRLYGPDNQIAGQKVYGYDIFFKYPSKEPILEKLYSQETSPSNWAKADSLRAINPRLADEFINSFSYHIDHGLGMDCYAVGETLGAGVAAIIDNDTIYYPWCYENARILDNGPLRFTVELIFAPKTISGGCKIREHRIISLDAGSRLNHCTVWYDGLDCERTIVAGFPRRDNSDAILDVNRAIIAYSDPTQRPDYGKALLGIIVPTGCKQAYEKFGHILIEDKIGAAQRFNYMWGFAWNKTTIKSLNQWYDYLKTMEHIIKNPLKITISK